MNLAELTTCQYHVNKARTTNQLSLFEEPEFPINTTQSEIEYIFNMICNSSYVIRNNDYKRKANNTSIIFDAENSIVNAYASSANYPSHNIHIFSGLSCTSKLMGIALATFIENTDINILRKACAYIGNIIQDTGEFTPTDVINGIDELEINITSLLASEASSYWFGSILSVIGHELGHICLSHTIRGDWTNPVSRNDERQADLFAHSIVSTTPFAKYNILSTLFNEVVFAWLSNSNEPVTTHPCSIERVMNTINSHEELLIEYGITKENIHVFLPN